jgi:putative spermidine/putrescine transport system substrate-binding protein
MKTRMLMTSALVMAGVAALALTLTKPAAAEDKALTVVSWGGAYQASQQEAYIKPFAKETGTKITEEEYNGEIAKIRAMVEAKAVTWDVVDIDTQTALAGCAEGILEPIDYAKIGVDKSKMIGGDQFDCAVPTILYSTIFAYDADKLKDGPKTVADLFDLQKFPGKRALQKNPFINLEWALMADGVATKDLYKVLNTKEGVDRAFKKLDTIKKDVVWWEAGAQTPQLLADGQVVMGSTWNGRIYNAIKNDHKNFVIVWDGQAPDYDLWAIPKGDPRADLAYQFIAFSTKAENQANQTNYISYGPANTEATPHIKPDVLKDLPSAPDNMKNAITVDPQFWADHGEELRDRFNAWLAQ